MVINRWRAQRLAGKALVAERNGDLGWALTALERAIALRPGEPEWHYRLGLLQGHRRRWLAAAASLATAVSLTPNRPEWHYRLGRARQRVWDLTGACDAYAIAVGLAPEREKWVHQWDQARRDQAEFGRFTGLVVAHRGRAGRAPENSIDGLSTIPAHVRGVEVDVRLTRDGTPVLMHDRLVDRTTDGQGEVANLTWGQVRRLALAGGGRISRLGDYLDACAGTPLRRILIDVKMPTRSTLRAVADEVRSSPAADRCLVMVRRPEHLREFRSVDGDLAAGAFGLRNRNAEERLHAAREFGAGLLLVARGDRRYLRNRAAVEQATRAGVQVGASTINSRAALEAARVDGCDVILTDVARELLHFVGSPATPPG